MAIDLPDALPDFDALWDYNKPAETEVKFREVLAAYGGSAETVYIVELKTQIARALGLQQKFDEAHRMLDEVLRELDREKAGRHGSFDEERRMNLAMTLNPAWTRVDVRYLLERGRAFNSSKQKDKALPLYEAAWNLAVERGLDFFAVDAAHMMAIAVPPDQVMEWNQKALALAEKSADPKARRWRGSLYNNIGWDYFANQKFDSALAMFERAVVARTEQEQPTEVRIARWCVAKAQRLLGRLDDALTIQRALEIEWRESGEGEDGFVFEEIAECLLSQDDPASAKPYFARAHNLLSADPWLQRDEPARLQRLKELGGDAE